MGIKDVKFKEADLENGLPSTSKNLSNSKSDSFEGSQSESCPSTVESLTTFESTSVTMNAVDDENVHENPFEGRKGKTLTWRNVNMKVVSRNISISTPQNIEIEKYSSILLEKVQISY